jgi:hypothetical protein
LCSTHRLACGSWADRGLSVVWHWIHLEEDSGQVFPKVGVSLT